MSEMIERVARALATKHYVSRFQSPSDGVHVRLNVEANWSDFADDATTAIQAMRQPTDAVMLAAYGHHYNFRTTLGRQKAINSWQWGIDAALQEKEAGE